jgi:hypothetical protein
VEAHISTQLDPQNIRVLSRVSSNGSGAEKASPSLPETTNQSPIRTGKPPGIVTGQPMPSYPVPPMVYGRSAGSGDNMDGWFDRWIRPLMQP